MPCWEYTATLTIRQVLCIAELKIAIPDQLDRMLPQRRPYFRRHKRLEFTLAALLQARPRGPQFFSAVPRMAHKLRKSVRQHLEKAYEFFDT